MSFETDNEERRKKEQLKKNMLKWYGIKLSEDPYYVGSLDLVDPYSGEHIYVPSKQYLEEQEEKIAESDNTSGMSEEDLQTANEIYERLMREAAADEMARQAEIEAIKRAQEEQEASSADYNAATGSYSGLYGKKPMNDDEADALAAIMNQNSSYSKSIEDIIKENQ